MNGYKWSILKVNLKRREFKIQNKKGKDIRVILSFFEVILHMSKKKKIKRCTQKDFFFSKLRGGANSSTLMKKH